MPSFLTIALALATAYLSTFIYSFLRNLLAARKSGFPLLLIPWDQNHLLWMVLCVPLRPHLQKWLPKPLWDRLALSIYGFEFHEGTRPFEQYLHGQKSYMHVGMGKSEFWTSDPEIAFEVLRRPRDFQQHPIADLFIARFGHNVLTTNGDRWARQRRIIAGVINERVSKAVFAESVAQTEGLVAAVFKAASGTRESVETMGMFDMMKKVAIHVLSGATMGSTVPFNESNEDELEPGFRLTYNESVKTVINAFAGPIILPKWFMKSYPSFLPGRQMMQSLGYAMDDFPAHMKSMLAQERQRTAASKLGQARSNIMSQLLQASEASGAGEGLSQEEMLGNLFVFGAAGFDTTANTLSYALVLLARYPAWQAWLVEEVDRIFPAQPTSEQQLEYSAVFPQATRTLAFMYETLRLYTPLVHLAKVAKTPQLLSRSRGEYWLPADTTVYVNNIAVHLNADVYRNLNLHERESPRNDDECRFRPSRWLNAPGNPQIHFQPPKGGFLAWSAGPRVCPGMAMAKVEFSAVLLTLLRRSRLEAVALEGEARADTDRRLEARLRDSMSVLTLQMNGIYDVGERGGQGLALRVVRRRGGSG
ncbi:hypothetical protein LTR82_016686 [Friedmanniomyces endolithicus]|uniref:Cytochrome P450 n=2 Tax=Friedmanniomyces endolithicus TaxID=329885 RepID=A0AAN6J0G4_9PEZI|nr:hypothetical protein LTR82_016686 [Friedmanniomyces endolithicus]